MSRVWHALCLIFKEIRSHRSRASGRKTTSISGGNESVALFHSGAPGTYLACRKAGPICFHVFELIGEQWMTLDFGTGYVERSRIENTIRELELSLLRIDAECSRIAVQVAERNLMRGLLALRRPARGAPRYPTTPHDRGGIRRRYANLKRAF